MRCDRCGRTSNESKPPLNLPDGWMRIYRDKKGELLCNECTYSDSPTTPTDKVYNVILKHGPIEPRSIARIYDVHIYVIASTVLSLMKRGLVRRVGDTGKYEAIGGQRSEWK